MDGSPPPLPPVEFPSRPMLLTFDHVTKFYGPVIGVNDVSCQVGAGITGLLGANGAGKSTLMKLASGQLRPSAGRVAIGSRRAWSAGAKRDLGFSPDLDRFYEEMTCREFVSAMARLYGYAARESRRRTELALEEVGMTTRGDRRLGGCSHGMRQRIKLAQALVHDPPILLLDEPLTGIDPQGRRDISHLLRQLAERGKTILLSSHLLAELEQLADSILVIARGRIVASGTLAEIRGLLDDQPYLIEIVSPQSRRLAARLVEWSEVLSVEVHDGTLRIRTRDPVELFRRVGDLVVDEQFEVQRLETLDAGAEAVFRYVSGGAA